ncbi:hypothetical protein HI914_00146 [Erysiphe necator]|nr:hypothetical protein HI914_00146 [Erysiphe necator]
MLLFGAQTVLGAVALFSSNVFSQSTYSIVPSTVPLATRNSWCTSQTTSCPLLCLQYPEQSSSTTANTCDPKSLSFNCICQNGMSPNASEYSQTLPFFICQEYGNQCVTACNGNTKCQSSCREDHPCGAQNPTRINTTSTPSIASPTSSSTSGVAYTGLAGSDSKDDSSNKSGTLAALDPARGYLSAIIFACIFAGFAIIM